MQFLRLILLAGCLVPACAIAGEPNDLREFRVGMPVSALPQRGYVSFDCADDPGKKLSGWTDWASCPAAPKGFHAVGFRYEDALQDGEPGKTQVGGQPVHLALLIDDQAIVAGIRIETDPHTPLYLHKKAFLFGLQAKARYGEDGWTCRQQPPTSTEQPVGGVFVHEHCEKTTQSRHFIVDRELFRDPSQELRSFTGATHLVIERPDNT